jgi:hypothetical protein
MRNLAKDRVGEAVLKELFLAQLPETLRGILVVIESASLETLAAAADRGWESGGPSKVESLTHSQSTASNQTQQGAERQMNEIMDKMVEVLNRFSRRDSGKSPPRRRDRSQTPGRQRSKQERERSDSRKRNPKWKLCRYHFKFGDNARKCENWCERWATKNSEN